MGAYGSWIDLFCRWPVAGPVSGGGWGGRWPVAGDRWPVAGWPVAGTAELRFGDTTYFSGFRVLVVLGFRVRPKTIHAKSSDRHGPC